MSQLRLLKAGKKKKISADLISPQFCFFRSTLELVYIGASGGGAFANYTALSAWRDPREVFANFAHLLENLPLSPQKNHNNKKPV